MPTADSMKASKQFSITGIMKDSSLPALIRLTLAHIKKLYHSLLKSLMLMVKTSKLLLNQQILFGKMLKLTNQVTTKMDKKEQLLNFLDGLMKTLNKNVNSWVKLVIWE